MDFTHKPRLSPEETSNPYVIANILSFIMRHILHAFLFFRPHPAEPALLVTSSPGKGVRSVAGRQSGHHLTDRLVLAVSS